MSIEMTVSMIRALKGAPLSCLMILALSGQPLSAQYLERTSGYSDKTVNSALLLLEDFKLVSRNGRYNWQITAGAKQLPLMNLEIEDSSNEEIPVDKIKDGSSDEDDSVDEISGENPDNSDYFGGTRRNSESENFRLPSSRLINLEDQEIKDPPPIRAADPENLRVAENLAECDRFGIRNPKRESLSELEHVDARLIRYHCSTAGNIGLAIYRIEKGWRVKKGWIDSGENVCAQTLEEQERQERWKKYAANNQDS